MGAKYSLNCSHTAKRVILHMIILQYVLINFRGGAIEYCLLLSNCC